MRLVTAIVFAALLAQRAHALVGGFIADISVTDHGTGSDIALLFNCATRYVTHSPASHGRELRIQLDSIQSCTGVNSLALLARDTKRVATPRTTGLIDVEYVGDSPGGPQLVLRFENEVKYVLQPQQGSRQLNITVLGRTGAVSGATSLGAQTASYAINLESVLGDAPSTGPALPSSLRGLTVYGQKITIAGQVWNRLRLGFFDTETDAAKALSVLQTRYPKAWVTRVGLQEITDARNRGTASAATTDPDTVVIADPPGPAIALSLDKGNRYLEEARQAMIGGESSRAIQLYTKLLRDPNHPAARDAQELLGLARERNGQLAHAKAEYQRYLSRFPDGDGAKRVRQRLAALVAASGAPTQRTAMTAAADNGKDNWQSDTYLSQYYRHQSRDANGSTSIVNLSSLVSDADFRLRRRGARFDISTRLTSSYWYDFLGEDGPGNQNRVSQAYVELDDNLRKWRSRVGRQSRSTSGVLGRFDGLFVEYGLRDDIHLSFTTGFPVYSTRSGFDNTRLFYGMSVDLEDIMTNLDVTPYFNRQVTDGIDDRQSAGVETRYRGKRHSLIGVIDYDFVYDALNSVYLLGNWRAPGELTISTMVDRRHSPFLSVNNALLGQPLTSLDELLLLYTEPEILQLAQDRTAVSTSYRLGISRSLGHRWRIDADAIQTQTSGTTASAGVVETPASDGLYYSASLTGQSLLKQGDALIFGLRSTDTPSYQSVTATLDGRFPFGAMRINPRLRIDKRDRLADGGVDWIYSPRLRLQFRWRRNNQFELEAGGIFTNRKLGVTTDETNIYFFNGGYRYVF